MFVELRHSCVVLRRIYGFYLCNRLERLQFEENQDAELHGRQFMLRVINRLVGDNGFGIDPLLKTGHDWLAPFAADHPVYR